MVLEQAKTDKDYSKLVAHIYQASDFDFVGIALQQPYYPFLIKWRFAAGNQSERFRQIVLRRGFGIAGLVFRTGKPFYNNELILSLIKLSFVYEHLVNYVCVVRKSLNCNLWFKRNRGN